MEPISEEYTKEEGTIQEFFKEAEESLRKTSAEKFQLYQLDCYEGALAASDHRLPSESRPVINCSSLKTPRLSVLLGLRT